MERTTLAKTERRPAESPSLPRLQLTRNGRVVQEVSLDLPRLLIGRSKDNDLSIPSDYVSWYHILLLRHEGSTILIDLNSTNGTFVNSRRAYNRVLDDADEITVDQHSKFVQYSIKYIDPDKAAASSLVHVGDVDAVIAKALKDVGKMFARDDTDRLPMLSENEPTTIGFIDDR